MANQMNKFLNNIILQKHLWKIILLKNWGDIIGEFKENVIIEKIQDDLLILGVCHPVFAHELFLISDDIKKKVNLFLKEEKIKRIQFRYLNFDRILKNKKLRRNEKNKLLDERKKAEMFILTKYEMETLNKVNDENLKESLYKFYLRCRS